MTMQERYLALTEKRKIPEVIVVEGKDDTANLRRFYEVDTCLLYTSDAADE